MKKKTLLSLALIALLLTAAVPAAARSPVTHFVATGYVCAQEAPVKEWISEDGVLHQRGVLMRDEWRSEHEPRLTGSEIAIYHQDINLHTGAVQIWGTGTVLTDEGTWYIGVRAELTADGLVSHGSGYGADGLEGYFISWQGEQISPPFEDPPCETDTALLFTGVIRPGRGPRP
jgi:hypothetical protein